MSVVSTARRRAGVLWLAQGAARRTAGVSPGYWPRPHGPAPEGRAFVTVDLRESPLRGSQIIMRFLPRAYRPTSGRLPPWANHKASLRDSRHRSQQKTITLNHHVCVPVCVSHRRAAQIGLRQLHAKQVRKKFPPDPLQNFFLFPPAKVHSLNVIMFFFGPAGSGDGGGRSEVLSLSF